MSESFLNARVQKLNFTHDPHCKAFKQHFPYRESNAAIFLHFLHFWVSNAHQRFSLGSLHFSTNFFQLFLSHNLSYTWPHNVYYETYCKYHSFMEVAHQIISFEFTTIIAQTVFSIYFTQKFSYLSAADKLYLPLL
jgi:hypothetical protein